MTITPADAEDREWAAELMVSTDPWITLQRSLEQCRKVCHHPDDPMLIARENEQRKGFLLYRLRGLAGHPYIASIATQDRGQGVGTRLIQHLEGRLENQKWLFLLVSSFNDRARQLYQRLGFAKVGELPDHSLEGASEILMRKRL